MRDLVVPIVLAPRETGPFSTRTVRKSETSMTSTDVLPQVFATLRFAGDNLEPNEIRHVLPVPPRRAHRKGECYYSGRRAGYLTGRTGLWYLTTDALTDSHDLKDHVALLKRLL